MGVASDRPQVVTYRLIRADTATLPFTILPHANSKPEATRVVIQPLFSNTGDVYVGGVRVSTTGPNLGYTLPSPVSYGSIPEIEFSGVPVGLNEIYVLPNVNSEGVVVLMEPQQL